MNESTVLYSFNEKRKKIKSMLVTPGLIIILIGILSLLGAFTIEENLAPYSLISFLGFGLLFLGVSKISKLSTKFKDTFLEDTLTRHFQEVKYNHMQFNVKEIEELSILPKGNKYEANDLIEAVYNDVEFLMVDTKILDTRGKGTDTEHKGPYIKINWNKNFNGTFIMTNNRKLKITRNYKKMNLTNFGFNKSFEVYSTDDYSYIEVLSAELVENIMKIKEKHKGRFTFVFTQKEIIVVNDNRVDNFEISLGKEVNEDTIRKYEDQLTLVKDVITLLIN